MAKANPETIILKGDPLMKEAEAGGTITPGHLIRRSAAGTVAFHATAGGTAASMFAKENDIAGDEITSDYLVGEVVLCFVARPGDEVYAILADGEVTAVGSFLESNGTGELRVVDADTSVGTIGVGSIIGQALEVVDASDSAATAVASRHLRLEVI